MSNINVKELRDELNKAHNKREELKADLQHKQRALYNKYNLMNKELYKTLCLMKKAMEPFFRAFSNVIEYRGNYILFNGQCDGITFDYNTFDDVCKEAKGMINMVPVCLKNWGEFIKAPNRLMILGQITKGYNTILSLYSATLSKDLREQAWMGVQKQLQQQINSLDERIRLISSKIKEAEALEKRSMPTDEEFNKIFFHQNMDESREYGDTLNIPIGYTRNEAGVVTNIAKWNLIKKNTLYVKVPSEISRQSQQTAKFLQNTICHFINSYPICSAKWMLCDCAKDRNVINLSTILSDDDNIFYRCVNNKKFADLNETLNAVTELIDDRLIHSGCKIIDFNNEHPSVAYPLLLVVINGFKIDDKMREETLNNLRNIIEDGNDCGVYFLILEHENDVNANKSSRSRGYYEENCLRIDYAKNEHTDYIRLGKKSDQLTIENLCNGVQSIAAVPSDKFNSEKYKAKIKKMIKDRKNHIDLDELISEYERDDYVDFAETITIPLGLHTNADVESISFHTRSSEAHCVIAGMTGSGKSSILQAIVLGGAYIYSPEEIEFYIIDMKDGTAFYKKENTGGFDYSKLKHVRMMAMGCKQQDLRDFISHIVDTRLKIDSTDIVTYNKNNKVKMKRTFIIIDEYTEIKDDKCIDELIEIARKGRAFGVSLILASQKSEGRFKNLTTEASYKVQFKSDDRNMLFDQVKSADKVHLYAQQGNCIIRCGEMNSSKFRAAFAPDQNAIIEKINAKYSDIEAPKTIVIGAEERDIRPYTQSKLINAAAYSCDTNDKFTAKIGHNLFGAESKISMNQQVSRLLLMGDCKRSFSVEYSFMTAFTEQFDNGSINFLNFSTNKFPLEFERSLSSSMIHLRSARDIFDKLGDLYEEYKRRARIDEENYEKGIDKHQHAPILTVLHSFDRYDEKKSNLEEREEVDVSPVIDDSISIPILSLEMSDEIFGQYMDALPKEVEAPKQVKASQIKDLIKNSGKYNMYFVVQIDTTNQGAEEIKKLANFEGDNLVRMFDSKMILPTVSETCDIEKTKVATMLDIANQNQSCAISKKQDLYRCYYIQGGSNHAQIIPYEWEAKI